MRKKIDIFARAKSLSKSKQKRSRMLWWSCHDQDETGQVTLPSKKGDLATELLSRVTLLAEPTSWFSCKRVQKYLLEPIKSFLL